MELALVKADPRGNTVRFEEWRIAEKNTELLDSFCAHLLERAVAEGFGLEVAR